jgi:hypothetical protein
MSHGPEQHIEHAEHAQHAAHDPFDRRVTMSIAIVAAILACVTMIGHRAHNDTLRLQGEAIQLQSEAGIAHSQEANKWAYYQAQNVRKHMYQSNVDLLREIAGLSGKEGKPAPKAVGRWKDAIDKYEDRLKEAKKEADEKAQEVKDLQKKAVAKLSESEHMHHRANRFDYGELGVELAVVLCSLAVLTKRRGFWYVGLLSCLAGTLVAVSGLLDLFMSSGH